MNLNFISKPPYPLRRHIISLVYVYIYIYIYRHIHNSRTLTFNIKICSNRHLIRDLRKKKFAVSACPWCFLKQDCYKFNCNLLPVKVNKKGRPC